MLNEKKYYAGTPVTVRITNSEGDVLAYFQASDTILSAEEIAAYLEDEAHDRFDVEAL